MGVVALVVSRNQEIQIRSQKDVPVHARAKGARATAVFGTKKNEVWNVVEDECPILQFLDIYCILYIYIV